MKEKFSTYQILVIIVLAFTQFTVILDFMIISPLGDMVMKSMQLTTSQFGLCVAGYALMAGISGMLTAGFADRYDRKKLLLFFLCGIYYRHGVMRADHILYHAAFRPDRYRILRRGDRVGFIDHRCRCFPIGKTRSGHGIRANGFCSKPGFRHTDRIIHCEHI